MAAEPRERAPGSAGAAGPPRAAAAGSSGRSARSSSRAYLTFRVSHGCGDLTGNQISVLRGVSFSFSFSLCASLPPVWRSLFKSKPQF